MSELAIGIDLGTSTSEIAVFQHGQPQVLLHPVTKNAIVPSLIAISSTGETLVGEAARSRVDLPGQGVREVKRLMGTGEKVRLADKEYRPEEMSALILRELKNVAESSLGETVREAVISVPANFDDMAKTATYNAAQIAGIEVLRLINEPTAAALAFGVKNIDVEEQLVVFDFGGGTLDVTALEMFDGVLDVKSSFGDVKLGGKDFDAALMNLLLQRFKENGGELVEEQLAMRELKQAAENAKLTLSTQDSAYVLIPRLGRRKGELFDLEVQVTRSDFEAAIAPLLDRARTVVSQALEAKKLQASAIDRVLLVGGTTYIPAVRNLVADMFGKPGQTAVHPDLAVALGAAVQAGLIKDHVPTSSGILIADVAAKGFGIDVVSDVHGEERLVYDPLIKPNHPIPFSIRKDYWLQHADQRFVKFNLYQDDSGRALVPEDAIPVGISGVIDDIPPNQYGNPHPLVIDFSYNLDGRIQIKASIPGLDRSVEIHYAPSDQRMSDEDILLAAGRVGELWEQSSRAKKYEPLIKRAERKGAEVSEEVRAKIEAAVSDLKSAMADESETRMKAAADELTDILFELETGLS